ncbi:hypothetical protein CYMTET_53934 [Cymbomonas tetramitiformis]|uniref:JmjC domain-containing protein n=1 Tax=Cymbomonas tetramitiformis TaxID=36881 RepID=A0AAE0BG31_9CHLO|nr:hypothetical protein CYMTET_53934 [Cymbomonas tetramitiformis]
MSTSEESHQHQFERLSPKECPGLQFVREQKLAAGLAKRFSSPQDLGGSCEVAELVAPCEGHSDATRAHLRDVFSRFVRHNLPVVIRGAVASWPCVQRWSDEYICAGVGQSRIQVRRHPVAKSFGDVRAETPDTFHQTEEMSVVEYVRRAAEEPGSCYAARIPIQAQADLEYIGTEVPPPDYLEYAAVVGVAVAGGAIMYWGGDGDSTPLHYDPHENFICVIDGTKKLRLYHPSCDDLLYPKDGSLFKYSAVDFAAYDVKEQFPLIRHACHVDVTLHKGDVFYLPCFWYVPSKLATT